MSSAYQTDEDLREVAALRAEVVRLLTAALQADIDHLDELRHAADEHLDEVTGLRAEIQRLFEATVQSDADHLDEIRRCAEHVAELETALVTREVIGQAQGIIMATVGCTAEEAF